MAIKQDDWIELIEREYAASFVPAGGSAVRFAVTAGGHTPPAVIGALRKVALRNNLSSIHIDTASTRLHLLQYLFFAVANAVDWPALTQLQLERIVESSGYRWPRPGQRMTLINLAESNGVAPGLLRNQLSQMITTVVWNNVHLAQDFRSAMISLLDCHLTDDRDVLCGAIYDWLRGQLRKIGDVKAAEIGTKIGRYNARIMLKSLCHWLRLCGGRGMMITIDIRGLLRERRDTDGGCYYTPSAVMDCYEVLRQMIDDADELEGILLVAIADEAFLDDGSRRALDQYVALKMRVWDDVRPGQGDNPLAPLVQLA